MTSALVAGGCTPTTAANRWQPYEFAMPAADVAAVLEAVEEDRTGIFWGRAGQVSFKPLDATLTCLEYE